MMATDRPGASRILSYIQGLWYSVPRARTVAAGQPVSIQDLLFQSLEARLKDVFELASVRVALNWFVATRGARPVAVIGSGFTRNALRKDRTPATWREAPLWNDIIKPLRAELRLPSEAIYDAPTLAELYLETFGPLKFVSTLRELVQDDELEPGGAHEALFRYPLEGVVTTNMLDTILDRNSSWSRVVEDADLSYRSHSAKEHTQLIYVHGHRHSPSSWVFTRSQFETLSDTRPLIVNRVTQLLSQHPVLAMGYSLADPDFHHLYRTISTGMAKHQPLGLAVMARAPSEPEKEHWQSLGIHCAVMRQDIDPGQALRLFLEINPAAPLEASKVMDFLCKPSTLALRISRLDELFESSAEIPLSGLRVDDYKECWLTAARTLLPDNLQIQIERGPYSAGKSPEQSPYRLKRLISTELTRWDAATLVADALLDTGRATVADVICWLVRWLEFARAPHRIHTITELKRQVMLLKHCLLQGDSSDPGLEKGRAVFTELAYRLQIFPTASDEIKETAWHKFMREAQGFALNGQYANAFERYESAAEYARRDKAIFHEWLSYSGMHRYSDRASARHITISYRLSFLEGEYEIREWVSAKDKAIAKISQSVLDYRITREEWEQQGVRGYYGINAFDPCLDMFRELELSHAPPHLLREFLQPLVRYGAFQDNPLRELGLRIKLDLRDTGDWLKRCVRRRGTEKTLTEALWDTIVAKGISFTDLTTTSISARLRALSSAAGWLVCDANHAEWKQFLVGCTRLRYPLRVDDSSWEFLADLIPAWIGYSQLSTSPPIAELYELVDSQLNGVTAAWLLKGLRELPWSRWLDLGQLSLAESLRHLCALCEKLQSKLHPSQRDETIVLEILSMFGLHRRRLARSDVDSILGIIASLAPSASRSVAAILWSVDRNRYRRMVREVDAGKPELDSDLEYLWWIADCSLRGDFAAFAKQRARLCNTLMPLDDWNEFLLRSTASAAGIAPFVRTLALWSRFPEQPPWLIERLLTCIAKDEEALPASAEAWPAVRAAGQWANISRRLDALLDGGVAGCRLLFKSLSAAADAGTFDKDQIRYSEYCPGAMLLGDAFINQSAVELLARCIRDESVSARKRAKLCRSFERFEQDSRAPVQAVIAGALARVAMLAPHDDVRSWATSHLIRISQDPRSVVQRRIQQVQASGKRKANPRPHGDD